MSPLAGHTNDDAEEQWRTIEVAADCFQAAVAVRTGKTLSVHWGMEPFHAFVRQVSLSRWLSRSQGASRMLFFAKNVCPSLDCQWCPSGKMKHPSKRKQVGAASRSRLVGQDVHLVPSQSLPP